MESFTRAVEIVPKESALQNRPRYRPLLDMLKHADRNSGHVQTRVATARILTELPLLFSHGEGGAYGVAYHVVWQAQAATGVWICLW